MLAVSDLSWITRSFLVIMHTAQEDLFYDISRYRGETHWPVVPQELQDREFKSYFKVHTTKWTHFHPLQLLFNYPVLLQLSAQWFVPIVQPGEYQPNLQSSQCILFFFSEEKHESIQK